MYKHDFINNLQQDERVRLNEFALNKLSAFLQNLNDFEPEDSGLLENIMLRLNRMEKSRIYPHDLFKILLDALKEQASYEAQFYTIKNFKGSEYEKQELLKIHFFKKRAKALGVEWAVAYEG